MKRSEFRNNAQTIPRIIWKGKNLKCISFFVVSFIEFRSLTLHFFFCKVPGGWFLGRYPKTMSTRELFSKSIGFHFQRDLQLCSPKKQYTDSWNWELIWKLKRSVSAPKCQFSPAGQSLIQPFLEPFEHNLGKKSSIRRLFQPTGGHISALGPNQH